MRLHMTTPPGFGHRVIAMPPATVLAAVSIRAERNRRANAIAMETRDEPGSMGRQRRRAPPIAGWGAPSSERDGERLEPTIPARPCAMRRLAWTLLCHPS